MPKLHIEHLVSLAPRTTYNIGGPARYYCCVHSDQELRQSLVWAREEQHPVFVLGRGSNILVSDAGWPGLVVDLSEFGAVQWDGVSVSCQGGALLHTVVVQAVQKGFSGMEELAGIPGSVGGAIVMNAGAFTQTISDCLVSVENISLTDLIITRKTLHELSFGYRTSSFREEPCIILNAVFCLKQEGADGVKTRYDEIVRIRREKHPLNQPNCGSVFKRPQGNYAGLLIEQCGLKGMRIGDAMVSEKHANFIVNQGKATAGDVRRLIGAIQKRVHEEKGVLLEPEVIFVGEFDEPLFQP